MFFAAAVSAVIGEAKRSAAIHPDNKATPEMQISDFMVNPTQNNFGVYR